jgi:hypothetical protein
MRNKYRDGDRMITVTVDVEPAIVDYDDILAATEVVPDEIGHDAPWECCDGWEHTVERINRYDIVPETLDEARGYCWHDGERVRIVLASDDGGVFDWHRGRGASRQVAAERVADQRRRQLDQLVKWYTDGWEWWGVTCEYADEGASVWGIDDADYADEYVRDEIASEVARQLEDKGYTVTGKPEDERRLTAGGQSMTADAWRAHYKRNLQCWS